jgi:hypothetical protein
MNIRSFYEFSEDGYFNAPLPGDAVAPNVSAQERKASGRNGIYEIYYLFRWDRLTPGNLIETLMPL